MNRHSELVSESHINHTNQSVGVETPTYKRGRKDEVYKSEKIGYNSDMKHHYCFCKKAAFTLAEVLITLGIIGIVATLTIPGLIAKHRKLVVETRLKKTYSVLFNAIRMSESENGSLLDPAKDLWQQNTYYSSAEFFDTYISPYLKNIVKSSANKTNSTKTVILADNTNIAYSAKVYQWMWNKNTPILLGNISVSFGNNKNNPVASKDYFVFQFGYGEWGRAKSDLVFIYTDGDNMTKCGDEIIKTKCQEEGSYKAMYCTAMIYCNGWKIPDDYPIKF